MSTSLKNKLLTVYRFIYRVIDLYAKTALVAVIAIVSAQVVARNVFKSNIRWNQEVSLLLTIWMAFLGISIGVDKGLHIQVELFYSLFPRALQRVIDRLNQVLLLVVGAFFTVYGVKLVASTTHSTLTVTKWPACLMYIMIPVAGVCIIYFVILKMLGIRDDQPDHEKGESQAP